MTTMRVVGECFFWYRLTRVFPDKFHRAVKRLCVVCGCKQVYFWLSPKGQQIKMKALMKQRHGISWQLFLSVYSVWAVIMFLCLCDSVYLAMPLAVFVPYSYPPLDVHCVSKKTTLMLHTITMTPILVIFGRDVAERACYRTVICYSTSPN